LIERYPVHYLSSGRDLVRLRDSGRLSVGLLAIGDPDYDASAAARLSGLEDSSGVTSAETVYLSSRSVRSECEDFENMVVSRLPGTHQEIESISQRWQSVTSEPLSVYFGPEASEDRFKAEASGNRVVHLATHGFFLAGVCQPEMPRAHGFGPEMGHAGENPLLLTGLLLAGANLHGEGADSLGAEDGILTAEEVTALNLVGTQLVVLSACESGLGEMKKGEGVYGLRRAFQMAGARTVISALWPVSDEYTAGMMARLYERRKESIPETMRRIQMEMINDLRQNGQPDHPFLWAGFIATGDWR
jgi:CHAT domain-containing protein